MTSPGLIRPEWLSLRLIVDGYNFGYQSGAVRQGELNPQSLRRARERVVAQISQSIHRDFWQRTLIVFDSSDSSHSQGNQDNSHSIPLAYSNDWNSADEMISTIIELHHAPKTMTVITSDHSIQRKAKARGAPFVDCEEWLDQARDSVFAVSTDSVYREQTDAPEKKPLDFLSKDERDKWLDEFGF